MTDPSAPSPDRAREPAPTEPMAASTPAAPAAETRPLERVPAEQRFPPAPVGASGDRPTGPGYAPAGATGAGAGGSVQGHASQGFAGQGYPGQGYPQPTSAGGPPPPPPGAGALPPKKGRFGRPPVVAAVIGGVLVLLLAFAGGFVGGFVVGRVSDGPGSDRFMMQGPGERGRFGDRDGRDFGEFGPRTNGGSDTSDGPDA